MINQCIFDNPQWQWTTAYKPVEFCGVENVVTLYDNYSNKHKYLVNIPSEFIRYLTAIHGADFGNVDIRLLKYTNNSGFLFCYIYRTIRYDLWEFNSLPDYIRGAQ